MLLILVFGLVLYGATLISELTERSILSTAVLFLIAGFVIGNSGLGLFALRPEDEVLMLVAELALFSVLYTDGMRRNARDIMAAWQLPGRALLLGMPLSIALIAGLARLVLGLSWTEALLVGAVLSPTDPVFAAAIIGRREIPQRLRHLLNVESGLNDGLALPLVLLLIRVISGVELAPLELLAEVGLGILIGVALPYLTVTIERLPRFSSSPAYEPFELFSLAVLIYALCSLLHANEFLAAYAAGITIATMTPSRKREFYHFGENVTELLKLAAILVFGVLLSALLVEAHTPWLYLFAALVLLLVRPAALLVALFGSQLNRREWLTAAWFGPKGFASVLYGLIVWRAMLNQGALMFFAIAITIAGSIVLHSSTDVAMTRLFRSADDEAAGPQVAEHG